MLFASFEQIVADPFRGIVTIAAFCVALLLAITVHEFSHSLVATRLGDPTSKQLGRLSLHPRVHLDPAGTLMLLFAGFGWGKPVPVNPAYLRIGARAGMAMVSLAGPFSNVVLASLAGLLVQVGAVNPAYVGFLRFGGSVVDIPEYLVGTIIFWNLLLASFNLLPVAPLDGFKVALGILPRAAANAFARLEPIGPGILLLLIVVGFVIPGVSILRTIIQPILNVLSFVALSGQVSW